ncbi:unnamed protein product, partial [Mesorhabditis belari]|uniref:Tudor domain-containing protein n=1 Tax=Mesorhabditis belari TaxID=2138241 RepID=A0AAF3E8P8_9BILA
MTISKQSTVKIERSLLHAFHSFVAIANTTQELLGSRVGWLGKYLPMDARRFAFLTLGSLSIATLIAWYISKAAKKRRALMSDSHQNLNTESKNDAFPNQQRVHFEEQENHHQNLNYESHKPLDDDDPLLNVDESTDCEEELEATNSTATDDETRNPEIEIEITEYGDEGADIDMENNIESKDQVPMSISPLAELLNSADMEPFSWSEEVERSYQESLEENEATNGDRETIESPSLQSQDSDGSSGDSGRATGGLASSLSPHEDSGEILPQYEFEIPNSLVGLIIGIKGKTIKELSTRTAVKMLIRPHHSQTKVDSHQICQVRGKRDQINKCLCMLRKRFPPPRFPELNLQPVMPPPLPSGLYDALHSQPTWLTLPEGVSTEVVISSLVDPGHLFLQQPTHPSFSSLNLLDRYMLHLYSQDSGIPHLSEPCETGLLCAAPILGAWFRAVTVLHYPEQDEVLVRFVDYGGYRRVSRMDLRQIRTDLMTLPFQSIECYLAHVQPVDGTSQWGDEAFTVFKSACMGKVIEAHIIGYHIDDRVPFVELSAPNHNGKVERVDALLMKGGLAKASDPSKICRLQPKNVSII